MWKTNKTFPLMDETQTFIIMRHKLGKHTFTFKTSPFTSFQLWSKYILKVSENENARIYIELLFDIVDYSLLIERYNLKQAENLNPSLRDLMSLSLHAKCSNKETNWG